MTAGILFIENYIAGGSDQVAHSLLHGLAFSRLTIMVNRGHDTSVLLARTLPAHASVEYYDLVTIPELIESARRATSAPLRALLRMAELAVRYPLFLFSIAYFRRRIARTGATVFIANNGGYPGANYCRSATIAAAMTAGVKVFHVVHGMAVPARGFSIAEWAIDRLIDRFARIITVCQATGAQLKKVRWIRQNPEVICNGLESRPLRSFAGPQQSLRILHVGYFDRNKNQAMLIRAVAELARRGLRELTVRFVGADPADGLTGDCRKLARDLGVADRIYFDGFSENVEECYANADLFVLCSNREGLSVAILEAMRAAKPVVATDVGGAREQIVDGISGFLVAPDDHLALADRIGLLASDPERRVRFGLAGRAAFEDKFTLERMLFRYSKVLGLDDDAGSGGDGYGSPGARK